MAYPPVTEATIVELARRRADLNEAARVLRFDTERAIQAAPDELTTYRLAKILGISQTHVARLRSTDR